MRSVTILQDPGREVGDVLWRHPKAPYQTTLQTLSATTTGGQGGVSLYTMHHDWQTECRRTDSHMDQI